MALKKAAKKLTAPELEQTVPANFLFPGSAEEEAEVIEQYKAAIALGCSQLQSLDFLERIRNSLRKEFMHLRMSPVELLQPNEEVEVEEESAAELNGDKEDSDASEKDQIMEKSKTTALAEEEDD